MASILKCLLDGRMKMTVKPAELKRWMARFDQCDWIGFIDAGGFDEFSIKSQPIETWN